ncbi:putative Late embryoproteinsis abundant protein group 8 protein [Hibiscus syriacus]|uniref:Late embryoproteinsis abundant protein group 8 protein n=1 Tax=Hibiscus syriacus TaxID=106335 RepID=A0A6A2XX57_HIBSY|nr:putative Late embryoproteinsis abundant protein group 8 protein [Hibiscus syriacus]
MECAAINCHEQQKREVGEEEEEEEEALSLCDLPLNLVKEENQIQPRNEEDGESQAIKTQEDFNFGSCGDFLSTKPEMCAADDVFFEGQILPFRVSVSSDRGSARCHHQDSQKTSRFLPRSGSMDYGSLSRFTSVDSSSRSSSTGSSHYSTNSSSNSSMVTARDFNSITTPKSKPNETRNNFNSHPSPKPQIRLSETRPVNVSSRNQTSSMWDFFRLGLVRAPELKLDYMKIRNNNSNRNSVSRNSSLNSSNTNSSNINQLDSIKGMLRKGLFSGCKCSVDAVETVPLNKIVVIKNMMKKNNEKEKTMLHAAMEEKTKLLQQEQKIKKKMKEKREGKQALSRHRTYEWLKEL